MSVLRSFFNPHHLTISSKTKQKQKTKTKKVIEF